MKISLILLCTFCFAALFAATLFDAAEAGNLDEIKAILAADPAQLNALDSRGESALHYAAAGGDTLTVSYLLDSGLDVNQSSVRDRKPLDRAAANGHAEAFLLLLRRGALLNDPNNLDDYFFPIACGGGSIPIVQYLLSHGFSADFATNEGTNGMMYAANNGKAEMIRFLAGKGAPCGGQFNRGGYTALHIAASWGQVEAINALVEGGADIDEYSHPNNGHGGYTALLFAIFNNRPEAFARLIELGADINKPSLDGYSPLSAAIMGEHPEMVARLLELGAGTAPAPCPEGGVCTTNGISPLHSAAIRGGRYIDGLIAHGADINARNNSGETPLFFTVYADSISAMQTLLRHHPDLEVKNNDDETALLVACKQAHGNRALLLLQAGAKPGTADTHRNTPLHFAAINGDLELVQALLTAGAKVNARDGEKHTALFYADTYNHPDVATLLRRHGGKGGGKPCDVNAMLNINAPGKAGVWYLGHSGWAIKTQKHLLVFDYQPQGNASLTPSLANGHLNPEELNNQPVTVFVSHGHTDHFDPAIGELAGLPGIRYVFGFDPQTDADFLQNPWPLPPYTYLPADSSLVLDDMEIRTLDSPVDDGSGFLIIVDGVTIYHSGDAVEQETTRPSAFSRSMDRLLQGIDRVDVAFFPIVGCGITDVDAMYAGIDETITRMNHPLVIPMHAGGNEQRLETFVNDLKERMDGINCWFPRHSGDHVLYRQRALP